MKQILICNKFGKLERKPKNIWFEFYQPNWDIDFLQLPNDTIISIDNKISL